MSTEPTPTPESQSTTAPPTDVAARGRDDPWAAADEATYLARPSARAQRQFDPCSGARLRNLMDKENAYCN